MSAVNNQFINQQSAKSKRNHFLGDVVCVCVDTWSIHVVKVLWNSKGFIQLTVIKAKLPLGPGFDGKHIICKNRHI